MDANRHLRAFLSRQKNAGYCIACLTAHGGFGDTCLIVHQVALTVIRVYPNALVVTFADCASCGIRSVCLLFPGKIIDPEENRCSLALLALQYLPLAA